MEQTWIFPQLGLDYSNLTLNSSSVFAIPKEFYQAKMPQTLNLLTYFVWNIPVSWVMPHCNWCEPGIHLTQSKDIVWELQDKIKGKASPT